MASTRQGVIGLSACHNVGRASFAKTGGADAAAVEFGVAGFEFDLGGAVGVTA